MLTRGAQVTGVASAALGLSVLSTGARVYVRLRLQKFFGIEDYLTVAAVALLVILCGLLLEVVNYGLGAHLETIELLEPQWLPIATKYIFVCELLYTVTIAMTKASIGFYFLRLAGRRYQRIIIHVVMAVVMLYSSVYFLFILLQCRPVSFLWDQWNEGADGSCISHQTLADVTYAHAAVSALTDWALGILPVSFVWGLKMDARTRLSIIFILSLGFFASSATIVRIIYIRSLTETPDYTWEGINLAKWTLVEPAIGITAASIATLRPLFARWLSSSSGRKKKNVRSSRMSEDSETVLEPNSGKHSEKFQPAYSAEFAKMMGLPQYGVVTTITGGVEKPKRNIFGVRRRKSIQKDGFGLDEWSESNASSQIDGKISMGHSYPDDPWGGLIGREDRSGHTPDGPRWGGIMKTTVITIED